MTISIGTNIAALRAKQALDSNSLSLSRALEQLASGTRIGSPSDDAAGLAVADQLRNQRRLAAVALRNSSDALSIIGIGDGALDSINSLLSRMAELAAQSGNGLFTNKQRSALQAEFTALASEVDRVTTTTRFNGMSILATNASLSFQVGFNGQESSRIELMTSISSATLADLGLAEGSNITYSISGITEEEAVGASRTALQAVRAAIEQVSIKRGQMGAIGNRLQTAISNVLATRDLLSEAESRIRDLDIAVKTSEAIRLSILNQVGTAILAQANQTPNIALRLLELSTN